jgi:uracil phosphoribosyltransferase
MNTLPKPFFRKPSLSSPSSVPAWAWSKVLPHSPSNQTPSHTPPTAIQTLLPAPVPIHHLGLFRNPLTLEPVEYYNNLPYRDATAAADSSPASSLAILLDPIIATGGTSAAAIQTLKEWGVQRIVMIAVLGAEAGVLRAAREWPEGTEVWIAGVDGRVDEKGMIIPGLGDVGDRLFMTIGK